MRTLLRLLAAAVCVIALAWWLAAGPNRGWTKTSVPVKFLDEVTGLEGVVYQKRFVPGLDFLGAALLGAALLAGVSFLVRKSNRSLTPSPSPS
jgi:hypothetical protein